MLQGLAIVKVYTKGSRPTGKDRMITHLQLVRYIVTYGSQKVFFKYCNQMEMKNEMKLGDVDSGVCSWDQIGKKGEPREKPQNPNTVHNKSPLETPRF